MDHLPNTEFLHKHFSPLGARVYLGSLFLTSLVCALVTIYSIHTKQWFVESINIYQAELLGGIHFELITFLIIMLPLALISWIASWLLGKAANTRGNI